MRLWVPVAVFVGIFSACSSTVQGTNKEPPDEDTGGLGGAGGSKVDEPSTKPVACTTVDDCPAAQECAEPSRCEDGICVVGESLCGAFDEDNCICEKLEDGCAVVGADSDGDGVKSALCEADPGDDCDDSKDSVYPGADELCDGLDNDCDGLFDLDEGLVPFVRRVDVPAGAPYNLNIDMAWSEAAGAYGVVFQRSTNRMGGPTLDTHLGLISLDGTFEETLTAVVVGTTTSGSYGNIVLEYGHDEFALAVINSESGENNQITLQRIAKTGRASLGSKVLIDTGVMSASNLQLLRSGPDDWLVSWDAYVVDTNTTNVARIHKGVLVPEESAVKLSPLEKTAMGPGMLLGWSTTGTGKRNYFWSAFSEESTVPFAGGSRSVNGLYSSTIVSGNPLTIASTDTMASESSFTALDSEKVLCDEVSTPYLNTAAPESVERLPDGWVIVNSDTSRASGYSIMDLRFSRVYADCSSSVGLSTQAIDLDGESAARTYGLRTASNGKGIAVMWAQTITDDPKRVALFGPNICDDPDQ